MSDIQQTPLERLEEFKHASEMNGDSGRYIGLETAISALKTGDVSNVGFVLAQMRENGPGVSPLVRDTLKSLVAETIEQEKQEKIQQEESTALSHQREQIVDLCRKFPISDAIVKGLYSIEQSATLFEEINKLDHLKIWISLADAAGVLSEDQSEVIFAARTTAELSQRFDEEFKKCEDQDALRRYKRMEDRMAAV